ncbi:EAP30/Vps36 family-domain-containing protein [Hygrophoropsis aurantiaca]|uniref:EAP30/Vps36 family-domain-containing protein n=1 Tax=Hygrophoropsis aurantiaca TaxID=72124 RepID=A0ACB8AF82_9AGAM|nr:EAP30/Vps36 family-domain-containing protein [Hygrophoropsis aurantiaca]
MALRRYTTSVDGTIPISALLYNDEELLASQDNVGIYDGPQKSPNHQNGSVHVSTHRLFFVHAQNAMSHSFAMDLLHVVRTAYYAGLFKSSPKVTLFLDVNTSSDRVSGAQIETEAVFESWECEVCSHRNPAGLSPAAARICALCGVPRSAMPTSRVRPIATSLPSSAISLSSQINSSPKPSPSNGSNGTACPACTFINHPSMNTCEICSTPLPRPSFNPIISMKSEPSSRSVSPPLDNNADLVSPMLKLSFRKGGDKAFYALLRRALKSQTWEGKRIGKNTRSGSSLGVPSPDREPTPVLRNSGIGKYPTDSILRNVETSAQNTESDLTDAFKDLEALMIKAKDLVHLAGELNEKLTASSSTTTSAISMPSASPFTSTSNFAAPSSTSSMFSATTLVPSTEPEEAKFIRSSLSQLGLQMSNAPVTPDMIRDERRWIEELTKELAGVLQGSGGNRTSHRSMGIMKERGIVGLDEVWGGWNRARGVALIPPTTFLQTLPHLANYTSPPIRSRTFKSGLSVLHTPPYTHTAFSSRLAAYLMMSGFLTTAQIAQEENITMSLAGEMIEAVEADGEICRDDSSAAIKGGGSGSGTEVRWLVNVFREYSWDGQI